MSTSVTVSENWTVIPFTGTDFNRCLTTEYSETTAHFNGNFDTDNQNPRRVMVKVTL
jgi:hypothetical protein